MKTTKMFIGMLLLFLTAVSSAAWAQPYPYTGNETVCVNTTHNYGVADNPTSTYSWTLTPSSAGTVTVTGHNTISILWLEVGVHTLEVTETNSSGCTGVIGNIQITVEPNNTIVLTSGLGSDNQTVCINTAVSNITYATTGATGATFSGLPNGVTGSWAGNSVTIGGTPIQSGTFNYTVTLTGGCGNVTATGTIQVTPDNTIVLSSGPGSDDQTVCINTAIGNITYTTTGATGATFSGLPNGVTGSWAANTVTISGTPVQSGSFTYTITLTGGCGNVSTTGDIHVTPDNTILLSSAVGTDSQSLCVNTPLTTITYATTGATGATITGLPAGVSGSWAGNTVTIIGSPSVAGNYTYTIQLTGGCGTVSTTGTIDVTTNNTITLTSAVGTDNQTVCNNAAIVNITYTTTGATGATFTGLPVGVSGNWAVNVVTISGVPVTAGNYPYTVTLTGGCGLVSASGNILVSPDNTITLSSGPGSDDQTACLNSAISDITYTTTGATGATFSGLPSGVSGSWAANTVTITGTPTVSGNFTYTITLTGGCGNVSTTGDIHVTPYNTITLTSGAGSDAQTVCLNTAIGNITYATTGATGATFSGLPAGVTGSWAGNVVTISGVPSVSGTFTYTIMLTGGCGNISTTGTITVTPDNTIVLTSPVGSDNQTVCINTPIDLITYGTTGATGATFSGFPAGVSGSWAGNTVTVTGTPTESGTFTYTITLTGGCGTVSTTGTITVNPLPATSPIYHD